MASICSNFKYLRNALHLGTMNSTNLSHRAPRRTIVYFEIVGKRDRLCTIITKQCLKRNFNFHSKNCNSISMSRDLTFRYGRNNPDINFYSYGYKGQSKEKCINSKALSMLTLAFSIPFFSSKKEENSRDAMELSIKRAILAMRMGEFDKAEQLLHIVLKSAQELDDKSAVTFIYDLLANMALESGQYQKAHNIFVSVLQRILEDGTAENDNSVVEISLKLATIYANTGENEKAEQGFQFCINTQEQKLQDAGEEEVNEDTLVLWAMSQDWYARYLIAKGHYSLAKTRFEKALEICIDIKGPQNVQTAILLNDLGTVSSLQENYDDALNFLTRAIEIGEMRESKELPSFYINVAHIYLLKKDIEKALSFCKKGMHLAKINEDEEVIKEAESCLVHIKEEEETKVAIKL